VGRAIIITIVLLSIPLFAEHDTTDLTYKHRGRLYTFTYCIDHDMVMLRNGDHVRAWDDERAVINQWKIYNKNR